MSNRTPSQASVAIDKAVQQHIAESLTKLLEEKHLYQSVEISIEEVVAPLAKNVMEVHNFEDRLKMHGAGHFAGPWIISDPSTFVAAPKAVSADRPCTVTLSHISTYCKHAKCGRVQPFNLLAATDFMTTGIYSGSKYVAGTGYIQNFVLSFLCQGCKKIPEVSLVRRVGAKISIVGRSPMEHIEVPKYIPSAAKQYVSGATLAHQSGQTLAGLFLLRTSIEQWLRSLGAVELKADQALIWYMGTLPHEFKSWAPSLPDIYGKLSEAIHKADASAPLFDEAKGEIDRHFDARRVRALPEPKYEPA